MGGAIVDVPARMHSLPAFVSVLKMESEMPIQFSVSWQGTA